MCAVYGYTVKIIGQKLPNFLHNVQGPNTNIPVHRFLLKAWLKRQRPRLQSLKAAKIIGFYMLINSAVYCENPNYPICITCSIDYVVVNDFILCTTIDL